MRKINYSSKNFLDYRTDLINFVRQYYPNLLSDFNDSSVGMMLIELNAAIGDNLGFHNDRMFQETQLDYAQERSSVLSLARTFGLKIPGKRPAITIADFSVTVPVMGDTFDLRYAPLIRRGAQISGGSKVFETVDDVDFTSPFTSGGIPNRIVIPNINSNQQIISYTLTKREIVLNGSTKIHKKVITTEEAVPFYELVLPDSDVLSIESVILLPGTNYRNEPNYNDLYKFENRWFEVDALAEDKVFIEDESKTSDNTGIKPAKWVRIDKKFITEISDAGFTKLIFGGGTSDVGSLKEFGMNPSLIDRIGDFINNASLGISLSPNSTLYVQYRVGGGIDSNIGPNVLKSVNTIDIFVNGPDNTRNNLVKQSLTVNNPLPAMGGKNEPSVEEVRHLVKYNFSSQNRAVTLKDYQSRIALMPSDYGVPFRSFVYEHQNKVVVSILGLDKDGKLANQSTNTLKENLAEYLSDYRLLNDYVEIRDGKILNLAFDVDLHIDKEYPKSQIIAEAIKVIGEYLDINKHEMGDNIYLSQLLELINNINGVLNVIDIKIFNKVGNGKYSMNEISQRYLDEEKRQIDLLGEFTIFGEPNAMFEIREPSVDIRVRVK